MSPYRQALPQLRTAISSPTADSRTTLDVSRASTSALRGVRPPEGRTGTERCAALRCATRRSPAASGVGVVLESATWRANRDWAEKLGYDAVTLADSNRKSIAQLLGSSCGLRVRRTRGSSAATLGPRGDGYRPGAHMSIDEAQAYHTPQLATFAETDADMAAAFTMNTIEEAVGITRAAKRLQLPSQSPSFGRPTAACRPGDTLAAAIEATDALTGGYPAYYMINCAHPSHFDAVLAAGGAWRDRVRGLRAQCVAPQPCGT